MDEQALAERLDELEAEVVRLRRLRRSSDTIFTGFFGGVAFFVLVTIGYVRAEVGWTPDGYYGRFQFSAESLIKIIEASAAAGSALSVGYYAKERLQGK